MLKRGTASAKNYHEKKNFLDASLKGLIRCPSKEMIDTVPSILRTPSIQEKPPDWMSDQSRMQPRVVLGHKHWGRMPIGLFGAGPFAVATA